jgi:hypothetical protein
MLSRLLYDIVGSEIVDEHNQVDALVASGRHEQASTAQPSHCRPHVLTSTRIFGRQILDGEPDPRELGVIGQIGHSAECYFQLNGQAIAYDWYGLQRHQEVDLCC